MKMSLIYKGDNNIRRTWNIVGLVLIVITILAVIASRQTPVPIELPGRAKAAKLQIEAISKALESFKADTKRYPTSAEGLQALITNPNLSGWQGPYINAQTVPKDTWQRPLHYQSPGKHGEYDLSSYGKDGVVGGRGPDRDIMSWESKP